MIQFKQIKFTTEVIGAKTIVHTKHFQRVHTTWPGNFSGMTTWQEIPEGYDGMQSCFCNFEPPFCPICEDFSNGSNCGLCSE